MAMPSVLELTSSFDEESVRIKVAVLVPQGIVVNRPSPTLGVDAGALEAPLGVSWASILSVASLEVPLIGACLVVFLQFLRYPFFSRNSTKDKYVQLGTWIHKKKKKLYLFKLNRSNPI